MKRIRQMEPGFRRPIARSGSFNRGLSNRLLAESAAFRFLALELLRLTRMRTGQAVTSSITMSSFRGLGFVCVFIVPSECSPDVFGGRGSCEEEAGREDWGWVGSRAETGLTSDSYLHRPARLLTDRIASLQVWFARPHSAADEACGLEGGFLKRLRYLHLMRCRRFTRQASHAAHRDTLRPVSGRAACNYFRKAG
jgi:hypothetical protein